MRTYILVAALLAAAPAHAQEADACDQFKWPLARERALLAQASPGQSGDAMPLESAVKLALLPAAEAKLPLAPARVPKDGSFAGFVRLDKPSAGGTWRVTLTANAWIEVVQDGKLLPVKDFSGVTGCDGLRKSVKFELTAQPFVVEIAGAPSSGIGVAVTQD